jgi:hypothetical protein
MADADTADRVKRLLVRYVKFGTDAPSSSNDNDYSNTHLTSAVQAMWALTFKPVFLKAGWAVSAIDHPTAEISSVTAEKIEINEAIAGYVAYELAGTMPDVDLSPGTELWKALKKAQSWLAMVEDGTRIFSGIARITGDLPRGPVLFEPTPLFTKRDDGEGNESDESTWTRLDE